MRPIAKLKNKLSDYLPSTYKGEGVLARADKDKMQEEKDKLEHFRELQHKGLSQKEKAEEFWEYRTSDQN